MEYNKAENKAKEDALAELAAQKAMEEALAEKQKADDAKKLKDEQSINIVVKIIKSIINIIKRLFKKG